MSESTNDRTESRPAASRRHLSATQWSVVLLTLLTLAAVVLVRVGLQHSRSMPTGSVTTTGSGTVQGAPDTASFQIGVQNVARSAVQALSTNTTRVSSLETSLLEHGVTQRDMQTSGLNIYENTNAQGVVTGFTVSNDLNVTMHQIGRAGTAIDAAVHAVGNGVQLSGVSFSISNESRLLAAARTMAMRNARTEASQVAAGGGAKLGNIEKIADQENSTPDISPYANFRASGLATSVPLEAGSQSINVQVSVTYALTS